MEPLLFEDNFDVNELNANGKKFERVDRLHCKGTTHGVDLVLDINTELFPVSSRQRVNIAFANTLAYDGTPDDGLYNPYPGPSLLDNYDYVMHGRVFLIKHIEGQKVEVQASFGGLLLRLRGEQAQLESFSMDSTFYLLMKKVDSDIAMDSDIGKMALGL